RGVPIAEDRDEQVLRRDRLAENRFRPDLAGQRYRYELGARRSGARCAARLLEKRGQVLQPRVGGGVFALGNVVDETRELGEKSGGFRYRIDPERVRDRGGSPGDRHVSADWRAGQDDPARREQERGDRRTDRRLRRARAPAVHKESDRNAITECRTNRSCEFGRSLELERLVRDFTRCTTGSVNG